MIPGHLITLLQIHIGMDVTVSRYNLDWLHANGYIKVREGNKGERVSVDACYWETTEKAFVFIQAVRALPEPVQTWSMPNGPK